jgi:hypothetical protein
LLPFAHRAIRIDFDNADFGDAVVGGGGTSGFKVNEGEGRMDEFSHGALVAVSVVTKKTVIHLRARHFARLDF